MDKDTFRPHRRIEKRYAAAINRILRGLYKRTKGAGSPFQMLEVIRGFARSPTMDKAARDVAASMVTNLLKDGARGWRQAAKRGSKGRMIHHALQSEMAGNEAFRAIVSQNAALIRSVPQELAERLTKKMAKGQIQGKRVAELMKEIQREFPYLSATAARRIARTETSKASTAITRVRAETAGLSWYVWCTSEDARVRTSHAKMDGVICSWKDPPSPEELVHETSYGHYHAGEIFNCRCYAAPLVSTSDVTWPHKVYYMGKVNSMTLAQFQKLGGGAT